MEDSEQSLDPAPDSFSYLDELGSVRSKTKLREVRLRPWQCISNLHHLWMWRRFFACNSFREIGGCGSKFWVVR
uniref:Uncharacterized protein n=1 Tax=Fagus sylvatica TaxID=28930 RepID=A0A2N9FG15_FAGSY